jgi:hypothetical protein
MKLTRRKLAAALAAPALVAGRASAAEQAQSPAGDALAAAKARIQANSLALAKATVPMTTEPAFQFKA